MFTFFSLLSLFTFQYVSIITPGICPDVERRIHFTFQYVSIITQCRRKGTDTTANLYIPICFYYHSKTGRKAAIYQIALHSNMFLLSPVSLTGIFTFPAFFTFQYVSIITGKAHRSRHYRSYFTFQYVSIITMKIRMKCGIGYVFTFQYVSIITFCC